MLENHKTLAFPHYTFYTNFLHNNLQEQTTQLALQDAGIISSNVSPFQGYLMPLAHY